jgi:hypothetical protein
MPGWLHPGGLDDPMADSIASTNRGCFDAIGVPYTFGVYQSGELIDVCRRVLQTTGFLASYDTTLLANLVATEGPDRGSRIYRDLFNWQFCRRRNTSTLNENLAGFFWSGSGREHPRWTGKYYTIQANEYLPPGAQFAEPPETPPVDNRPAITEGDDLRRWSLFPRSAPVSIDPPTPYDVWQSYDAEPGTSAGLPADVYRSGVFPFPEVILWGCSPENYMQPLELRPIQL